MKRVKIKPKNPRVTLTKSEIKKMKWDATKEATDKACLIILCAMADELDLDDEQICKVMKRTDRYTRSVKDHLVHMEDIRKSLEKNQGITLKGWV